MFWVEMTECNAHFMTLRVFKNNDPRWVEFRGGGLPLFVDPVTECNVPMTPAQVLHDGMPGWHTCVLHAGERLAVMPHHDDFEFVKNLFEQC